MQINSSSQDSTHFDPPKYRADIDGLRAVSILLVIGYHAFPALIKGGFIGVDIFFVISGFLISTIIFENLQRGSFGFIEFYSRRVRRIFPAVIIVLVVSIVFGWLVLHADEYKQLGQHIAGGAAFISNFILWKEASYFDNTAETKPLLHLWSLAIEEQFYILWPLILWFAWRQKLNLMTIAIAVGAFSFAINVYEVQVSVKTAFYSPQTRFWELMAGSILAYSMLNQQDMLPNIFVRRKAWLYRAGIDLKSLRNVSSASGFALISIGVLLIDKEKSFPGYWALLPTLGALLIISAGTQTWLNKVILSNRALVWIGLISFPLYLWHWPLLSFTQIITRETPSHWVRVLVIMTSTFLAIVTYQLIERPIRSGKNSSRTTISLLALMLVVGFVGYKVFKSDGFSSRLIDNSKADANPAENNVVAPPNYFKCGPDLHDWSICNRTETMKIAMIGDSHSGALWYAAITSGNKNLSQAINIGMGACPPALGAKTIINAAHSEGCEKVIMTAINLIEENTSIEFVTISTYGKFIEESSGDDREMIFQGFKKTIQKILTLNRKVIFVIDHPALKKSPKTTCEESPIKIRNIFVRPAFCSGASQVDLEPRAKYNQFVDRLRKELPSVVFFDTTPIFCQNEVCKVFENSELLYTDNHHLSPRGGSLIIKPLIKFLEDPTRQ